MTNTRPVTVTFKINAYIEKYGKECKGDFHMFYQYVDGEYSDVYALVELPDGVMVTLPTDKLVFNDK